MAKKLFFVGLMLCLLTGCVKGNVELDFVDENNPSLTIVVLFQEDLFKTYDTSLSDLKDKLSNSPLNKWKSTDLHESIQGTNYEGIQLTAPSDIDKSLLNFLTSDKKKETHQVTIDQNTINQIFNTSEIKDLNNYSLENLKRMGLELNLLIKMPGSIEKTSYGKIKDNQVHINLLDFLTQDKVDKIMITSSNHEKSFKPTNILIFIILIGILYLILQKR